MLVRLLLLFLACCGGKSAQPAEAPAAPSSDPARPTAPPAAPAAAGDAPSAGGLTWSAPPPFVRKSTTSSMRAATYGIDGDDSSELGVFFFGADQGGSVDANMTRWISQFSQADGSETKAKRGERSVNGLTVATIEASGVYSGGMAMPGAPPKAAIPEAGLLGAIAQGPGGAVFFKLTGPRAAIEQSRPAFDGLIESIKPLK